MTVQLIKHTVKLYCPYEKWIFKGKLLEIVSDLNYLGTVFNYNGSFSLNQKTLANKGLRALNVLLNKTRQYDLKPSVMCDLFDAFASSTLN